MNCPCSFCCSSSLFHRILCATSFEPFSLRRGSYLPHDSALDHELSVERLVLSSLNVRAVYTQYHQKRDQERKLEKEKAEKAQLLAEAWIGGSQPESGHTVDVTCLHVIQFLPMFHRWQVRR